MNFGLGLFMLLWLCFERFGLRGAFELILILGAGQGGVRLGHVLSEVLRICGGDFAAAERVWIRSVM
jgi:hypothetical protein